MKITFNNGYYEGDVNSQREMHGYGTFRWNDGNVYAGEWRKNIREGRGTLVLTEGARYEGEWRDDKREGRGIYTSEDGKIWEGIFHDYDGDPIKQTLPDGTVRYGVLKDFTFIPNE